MLVVQLRDMFGNRCAGGDQPLRGFLDGVSLGVFKDCGEGQYTTEVNFSASRGLCNIDVTLYGRSMKGCPFAVTVESAEEAAVYQRLKIDPAKIATDTKASRRMQSIKAAEAAERRQKASKLSAQEKSGM